MFSKILVANRGEIAVRIMATAREMGIGTVAVYSRGDSMSLHVLSADEAVLLGDSDPAESYLNADRIIAAALDTGAEAIHPGYGFLSENPEFAAKVAAAGLAFIGPPAEVMAKLGNKTTARRIMMEHGVPVIPGMISSESDPQRLATLAEDLGFPVLVKAAAGGGGKGMRIVETMESLAESAELAASEALSAFGDGSVYLEKLLVRPRHVEFQILADAHGNVVHLFERECSIQRRHQKIIEETPSPALHAELREQMAAAAVTAARAAGYVNAGTVEFLVDQSGNFYFLEVNTRLQVEHPITEMTTGIDLVRRQLEVAAGLPLPFTQEEIVRRGHAIECRIYAEDPARDFMPSPGTILFCRTPEGPGVRYDHGIYPGFEIPVNYDPILGKLVVWAEDRPAAVNRMIRSLKECAILGVSTPVEFLLDVVRSAAFRSGDTHTNFIDEHFSEWHPESSAIETVLAAAAHEMTHSPATRKLDGQPGDHPGISPWNTLGSWDLAR
ncbi:MAG TPA: acetyl-CoA carboxylase biotin carboxylase subunit [Desulfomonilaceae bacterium]|nr:acetyl-CoA carboxylase biotin carboxylase subunit [Desulfomonilaceae bacterium]